MTTKERTKAMARSGLAVSRSNGIYAKEAQIDLKTRIDKVKESVQQSNVKAKEFRIVRLRSEITKIKISTETMSVARQGTDLLALLTPTTGDQIAELFANELGFGGKEWLPHSE